MYNKSSTTTKWHAHPDTCSFVFISSIKSTFHSSYSISLRNTEDKQLLTVNSSQRETSNPVYSNTLFLLSTMQTISLTARVLSLLHGKHLIFPVLPLWFPTTSYKYYTLWFVQFLLPYLQWFSHHQLYRSPPRSNRQSLVDENV